jgi:hypothetical protein
LKTPIPSLEESTSKTDFALNLAGIPGDFVPIRVVIFGACELISRTPTA